ncbi:MAG: antibiotic biosynthesis monooxygenase [Deltaproteobacteria bacterium]|nr:antibiotic biosynthesis monooxygenase [Deltaproteobacteria bacterium]
MSAGQVTVVVCVKAKPETKTQAYEALQKLLAPTRLEKGCINYDMHVAKDDDSVFLFHENWISESDMNNHLAAPHIQRIFELAPALLAEPIELTLWRKVD